MRFGFNSLLVLLAVIVFVLAAVGVTFSDLDAVRMVAVGLALWAASQLVP